jgi:hypothetical protein
MAESKGVGEHWGLTDEEFAVLLWHWDSRPLPPSADGPVVAVVTQLRRKGVLRGRELDPAWVDRVRDMEALARTLSRLEGPPGAEMTYTYFLRHLAPGVMRHA